MLSWELKIKKKNGEWRRKREKRGQEREKEVGIEFDGIFGNVNTNTLDMLKIIYK